MLYRRPSVVRDYFSKWPIEAAQPSPSFPLLEAVTKIPVSKLGYCVDPFAIIDISMAFLYNKHKIMNKY